MENLKLALLVFGIVCTGLTAGLCFTWSNAVTPGIGQLDNFGYLSAFQAMNRAILNAVFKNINEQVTNNNYSKLACNFSKSTICYCFPFHHDCKATKSIRD